MPVRLDVEGGIGTIVLDRPPLNILDREHQRELTQAAGDAAHRDDIRAVMITGAGGVFSAGADIREMHALPPEEIALYARKLQAAFMDVATIPKPTYAAVEGYALGGGLELALAADVRICGMTAMLGLPEIRLGVIPGAGGTQRLTRLVGRAKALELIYTGDLFHALHARDLDVVDCVVSPGTAAIKARESLERLAKGPRAALAAVKRAVAAAAAHSDTGFEVETRQFAKLFGTDDQKEGMAAFLEKRDPEFS